jgi:hypothetical protein
MHACRRCGCVLQRCALPHLGRGEIPDGSPRASASPLLLLKKKAEWLSGSAQENFEEWQIGPPSRTRRRAHSRKAHAFNITTLIPKSLALELLPFWTRPEVILVQTPPNPEVASLGHRQGHHAKTGRNKEEYFDEICVVD